MNSLFQRIVKENAPKVAIKYGHQQLTYKELDYWTDKIAAHICNSGHTPEECPFVGVYSSRSLLTIPMMIGIWKAGFAYVPMDPRYSAERIGYIINDCGLKLILSDCKAPVDDYPQAEWLNISEPTLANVSRTGDYFPQGRYAYAIYTSGTTGKPKGTPITHQGLRNLIEERKSIIPPSENTTESCLTSISFDFSVWEMFCPLMTGVTVYLLSEEERNDPQRIANLLEEQHITTFSITPTHLSIIPYRQFPELKYLVFGGEPCPQELIRKWQDTCTVINAYGPTEATVFATVCIHHRNTLANDIGLPFKGVTCYVLDEQRQQVPDGEKGELFLGGIQVTDGYLNKEELNRQKFIPNTFASDNNTDPVLYATGDIVYRQPDGHYIYCGRKDNQVKIHGFRIELGEVKTALESCQAVEAAAVEVVGQHQQKHLRAFVKATTPPLNPGKIKEELKGRLPYYMIPSRLIEVDYIPKNNNGKIDFNVLATMVPSSKEDDNIANETEQQLADIWHEILSYEGSISSDSNFIELGGDSISIILMIQQINNLFNIQLSLPDVYNHLELSSLAAFILSAAPISQPVTAKQKEALPEAIPLPFHLHNLYTHCLLSQQISLAYNLVELIPFDVAPDMEKLLKAWNDILQSQDALRMTFHADGEKAFLKVHDFVSQQEIPVVEVADDEAIRTSVIQQLSKPYDLEKGPLYSTTLYHNADGRWMLAVYIHHLVSDGWSLDEIRQQLLQQLHQPQRLPDNSFAEYVYATYQKEQTDLATESRHFWNQYLEGVPPLKLQDFITDKENGDYTTGVVANRLSDSLSEAVTDYCSHHRVTLFSFLASALMIVMRRASRQQQFTIGYPTSGRNDPAQLRAFGYFVHPCPMKFTDNLLDMSFDELCRHTMGDIREAEANPYASLTLPPVNFTLESIRQETRLGINLPFALAPLTLTIDVDATNIQCRWLFRKSMANVSNIETLSRCYETLLQNIVEGAEGSLARHLSMVSKQEAADIIAGNTIYPLVASSDTIVDVFRKQVAAYPEKQALKDSTGALTYRQLDEASGKVASCLLRQGLSDKAVGLFTERSNKALIGMMGIIKAGCFYVPINQTYPDDRIRDIVDDSDMACIVTTRQLKDAIATICPSRIILCVEDMLESQPVLSSSQCSTVLPSKPLASAPHISASTPAYMIYTSGTTGRPKGVIVTHADVVSMVTIGAPGSYAPISEDRVIQFSTYLFDASVIDIFTTLLCGATLVTASENLKQDPEGLFNLMEEEKITWACIPPSFLHACNHQATTHLKTILVGGESPSQTIINRYHNIRFINGYGPTENTVCSTVHDYSRSSITDSDCIGKPIPGVTCYVLDDDHNLLPDGMVGELFLGGLQLATGYHHRPELNSRCFIENPYLAEQDRSQRQNLRLYATGDMVCRQSDGNLYFRGRKDFQVKVSGYRIELGDIEKALLAFPGVSQAIAEVRTFGDSKQLVAHVVTDSQQVDATVLRNYLSGKLPAYMVPAYWSFSQQLPLTANGKIDRSRLPAPVLYSANASDTNLLQGINQEELKCVSIVARLLDISMSSIDVQANLLNDLGMTSLHVLEFVSIMQKRGYSLRPSDIYYHKTIRNLVAYYVSDESSRDLTPEQVNSRICYFTSVDDKNKPLLLVVAGYPYYETEYFDFDTYFKKDYNILVIDSANEYYMYHTDEPINIDTLIKGYVELLRPILKDREIAGVTGLCLGSEIGLRLAVELNELHLAHPKIFVIDGYAQRTTYPEGLGDFVEEPGIDSELNMRRNQIIKQLNDSFIQKYYPGEVYLMLTTHFAQSNGQTKEEGEAIFPINRQKWLEAQPDVHIIYLDGLHMELLHKPHDLHQIKEVFDAHLLNNKA